MTTLSEEAFADQALEFLRGHAKPKVEVSARPAANDPRSEMVV